jgi:hypothetical protein
MMTRVSIKKQIAAVREQRVAIFRSYREFKTGKVNPKEDPEACETIKALDAAIRTLKTARREIER